MCDQHLYKSPAIDINDVGVHCRLQLPWLGNPGPGIEPTTLDLSSQPRKS